jgi:hypothetical protein
MFRSPVGDSRTLILGLILALTAPQAAGSPPDPLEKIGDQIFQNESSGKKENLVHWNRGEEFPSLGIGHFIWYPAGFEGPFDETYPGLRHFLKAQGLKLPAVLDQPDAPWKSKAELDNLKSTPDLRAAIDFLYDTRGLQVAYIGQRLNGAMDLMLPKAENPDLVRANFQRISSHDMGLYALIDYVNFKGEGVKDSERYNGQGWGLLQVLENMPAEGDAMQAFADTCGQVIRQRVANAPKARPEQQWLKGWLKRCQSYSTFDR